MESVSWDLHLLPVRGKNLFNCSNSQCTWEWYFHGLSSHWNTYFFYFLTPKVWSY